MRSTTTKDKYRLWMDLFEDPEGWIADYLERTGEHDEQTDISEIAAAVTEVGEALKDAILTFEDHADGKANAADVDAAAQRVESLPGIYIKYGFKFDAERKAFRSRADRHIVEPQAKQRYGESFAYELGLRIEQFKEWFVEEGEKFRIGVCHYPKCRDFYEKHRSDSRYCSKSHAKLHWQLVKRQAERTT